MHNNQCHVEMGGSATSSRQLARMDHFITVDVCFCCPTLCERLISLVGAIAMSTESPMLIPLGLWQLMYRLHSSLDHLFPLYTWKKWMNSFSINTAENAVSLLGCFLEVFTAKLFKKEQGLTFTKYCAWWSPKHPEDGSVRVPGCTVPPVS